MKHSLYTVDVEACQGEHILFNTLHGSLAALDEEAHRSYLELSGPHLKALHNAGFVLEDPLSELESQRQWFERDKKRADTLSLCIAPTYQCNLACPHCYENELDISGSVSLQVMESILDFVARLHQRDGFGHLFISWYGGEPTLGIDAIEYLSGKLIAFCEAHSIRYGAEIITNSTLIDKPVAQRLAQCRINHAMVTLAGNKRLHNLRRPCKNGQNSFALTLEGIDNLKEAGIDVGLSLNMDKKSLDDFLGIRDMVAAKGIPAMPAMIGDYLGDLSSGEGSGDFRLFSREEFSWVAYDWLKDDYRDAQALKGLLTPVRNFCRRQLENYFVIDALGDVYKCDGRMGYKEYSLFNICDDIDIAGLETATDNPMDDPECQACVVLPICKGQCLWDRSLLEDGCHPLKYTLEQYVLDYRDCFGAAQEPLAILVPPRNLEEFFSKPHRGEGLSASVFTD